jgi:hypothetical protein
MTLNSLILFAAVYFAAVATPGPGVAALIARVLGQGLGPRAVHRRYFCWRQDWPTLAATGCRVAKTFAGALSPSTRRRPPISHLAWRMATARRSWSVAGAGDERLARPRPAVADARQPKSNGLLPSIMPLVVDVRH